MRFRCLWENQTLFRFCFLSVFPISDLSVSSLFLHSSFLPSSSFPPFPVLLRLLSKTIKVKVIDDEEYEKNKTFYIEIGEPRLVESNNSKGQEGGEPRDPAASATVPAVAACSQHVDTNRRNLWFRCSPLLRFLLVCPYNDGEHAISCGPPHQPLHLMCVRVFLFLPCCLFTMHAFITSLCVCVCVRVCPMQEDHNH